MSGRILLIAAAAADALAALLHLAVIAGGASWYRFVGAGARMARMVERGLVLPHLYTVAIAGILLVWAAYALSGAGVIGRLPLLRLGLVVISAIYLVRSLALFLSLPPPEGASADFWTWSSLIVLAIGLLHALGTWRAWGRLG